MVSIWFPYGFHMVSIVMLYGFHVDECVHGMKMLVGGDWNHGILCSIHLGMSFHPN